MKKLLIASIIIIFISCDKKHPFSNYEGVYVLNKNSLDTLIIKNTKRDSSCSEGCYHGEYERRVIINDSLTIIQDELVYDSTMDALDFYNITIFEQDPLDNTFGYHNEILDERKNKKYSTSRFSTDILGKKRIYCDIKGFYYYKKIN